MPDEAAGENSTVSSSAGDAGSALPEGGSLTPSTPLMELGLGGPSHVDDHPNEVTSNPADGPTDEPKPTEAQDVVDDVDYLLRTFKVHDMSLRDADGTVDRKTLDSLMAAHGHLIADRIRIRGA